MPLSAPTSRPYVGSSTALSPRYYTSAAAQNTSTAAAVIANREYAQPFNLPGLVVDRLGINVTTGSTGNCRIGIYADDNGAPGALLVDGGVIITTNIALVEASITALALPEWCWIAAVFDATPTLTVGAGLSTGLGIGAPGTQVRGIISSGAQAYGALPVAFPAMTFSATVPLFTVRKT